jgi:hypothetical protein
VNDGHKSRLRRPPGSVQDWSVAVEGAWWRVLASPIALRLLVGPERIGGRIIGIASDVNAKRNTAMLTARDRDKDRGIVVGERGTKQVRVRLDSGREFVARRDELAGRRAGPGDRVRLVRGRAPRAVAVLEDLEAKASGAPATPSAPARALPQTLARAVAAAVAAGESAWVIAARHGIAVEQVRP